MAAGPISERNQGEWEERAQNGPRGAGRPRRVPAVFSCGREIGPPRRARDRPPCMLGAGWPGAGSGLVGVILCPIVCLPTPSPSKEKSQKENLQQNSKLDLKLIL